MDSETFSPAKKPLYSFPPEYGEFNIHGDTFNKDRAFSQEINSKMTMPDWISVDGKRLRDLDFGNPKINGSAMPGMSVPERITVTGSSARMPEEDPFNPLTNRSSGSDYVAITTPPRVLTVQERFPVIEDRDFDTDASSKSIEKQKERVLESSTQPSFVSVGGSADGILLAKLEQRVQTLEQREAQRNTRDAILYPLLAVYALYKIMAWVLRR